MSTTGRQITRAVLVTLAAAAVMVGLAMPAQAATRQYVREGNEPPILLFDKNPSNPANSELRFHFSINGKRYTSAVRAGSGNGSTNECLKNQGWLPNGTYRNISHYYKDWGVKEVQGWVWSLGNKTCSSGSVTRTELFIHSNGIEGTTWNSNYYTAGCIKVSQINRKHFHEWWQNSYAKSSGHVYVQS